MCSGMEEGILFSELRKRKHPFLCSFPQDFTLLHKGLYAVLRNLILMRFDIYCGPMHCAATHDWLAYISSVNIYLLMYCRIGVGLLQICDLHGERGNIFRRGKNVSWNPIAVCASVQAGQERSTDWRAASVIILHSAIKPGDKARVVKLEWHFALSHWMQQLSCI